MGWLLLLPFGIACWIAFLVVDACIKKGDYLRPLGVLVSLAAGAFCIALGYITAFVGFTETSGMEVYQVTWPIAGVLGMIIGVFTALVGSWRALVVTKEIIQVEEMVERVKEYEKRTREIGKRTTASKIVVCPKCGCKNRINIPVDPTTMYKCGKCSAKFEESTLKFM